MKRKILGVLTGVFLLLISAGAASATDYAVPGGSIRVTEAGVVASSTTGITEAEIPAKVGDIAVTAIGANAFKDRDKLARVVIPDSVKTIEAAAFYSCDALKDVTLPAGASLGENAFAACGAVTNATLTGSGPMTDFTNSYGWTPWFAGSYPNNHNLTVTIAEGVTSIGAHAFHGSYRIVKANVTDTVTEIGAHAFEGCSGLGDLDFVKYAGKIGQAAFLNCSGVRGAVTVRDGVATIPPNAFQNCGLQTLTIPDSVKTIEAAAFYSCGRLTDVTLPAGASLGENAFAACGSVANATLTGSGAMVDFTNSYGWTPWYAGSYPNNHNLTVTIEKGVTSIGAHAFHGAYRIVKATVADSVKEIGACAFEGCSALGGLDFVKYADKIGQAAFRDCSAVRGAVTVKDGVTVIPASAFQNCGLQTLTIPDSVKTIEAAAFYSCGNLTDVTLPATATLGENAFAACGSVSKALLTGKGEMVDFTNSYGWTPWYAGSYPNNHNLTVEVAPGVTSIGACAFRGSYRIVKATVADSVKKIGAFAFEGCSGLEDLEFVQYADEIGDAAFRDCRSVRGAVTVKDGVTVIPPNAFQDCGLQTLVIPDSVETIEAAAFYSCGNLTDVTLPAGATLGENAFAACGSVAKALLTGTGDMVDFTGSYGWTPWYAGSYPNNHNLTVEVAPGVTSIGACAFRGSYRIVKATVAESVKSIGAFAFDGCSGLADLEFVRYADEIGDAAFRNCSGVRGAVNVKDGVTVIPPNAFQDCGLQTLTLPDSVKTIKAAAFLSCGRLTDVTLPAGVTLEENAFAACGSVANVRITGKGAMSDFSKNYGWTPWYAGSYSNNHDLSIEIAQGVTSIGNSAFRGTSRLQSVKIPLSVARIDANAFYDCSTLHVYYAGSESQWGGVNKTLSKSNPNTLGNTALVMHYGNAALLVVTAPGGKTVISQAFAAPANTVVFVVGYDAAGRMTEFQSKTVGEALTFAVSDARTATVRALSFGDNFAPVLEPIPAAV